MKQKVEYLQKMDERNFAKAKEEALIIKKENLIVKQNHERNVYKQRLMSDYEEMKKIKQDELDKLIVKFKNKKLELEMRQKREKNLTGNENLKMKNAYASNLTNMTIINSGGNGMNRTMTKTGIKFSLENLNDIKLKNSLPENINFASSSNLLKNKEILKYIENEKIEEKEICVVNYEDKSPNKKIDNKNGSSKSPLRGNGNKTNRNNNNYSSNISIQNIAKNNKNSNSNSNKQKNEKNVSSKIPEKKTEDELIKSQENFKKKPTNLNRRSSQIKSEDKSNLTKRVLEFKDIKCDEITMINPNQSLRGNKELVFRENTNQNMETNTKGNYIVNQSNPNNSHNLITKLDTDKMYDEPKPIELKKKKF